MTVKHIRGSAAFIREIGLNQIKQNFWGYFLSRRDKKSYTHLEIVILNEVKDLSEFNT